ncbi:MAG TPA: helix-turn-helix domain-containing protein [Fibrobacteria bacterium]|nr:helix-turn-helix domain-containing protein [Fibrobacteria bacterium]
MSRRSYVTTGEIARICEVSPKTVIAWIERKQLRSFRIGRGPRKVTLADLYDFLASRNFPVGSPENLAAMLDMLGSDPFTKPGSLQSEAGRKENSITLIFDIEEYDSFRISELLATFSELYREIGGDGIRIVSVDEMNFAPEYVPVGV